ncbi:MAG: hypothetical protein BA867_01670 [Desulfobacterales bacterium S5133MH16]|nr:MAG: hypothetical protein BA867_01670 [Desulfobacterales bacterium S5133MH16]
MFFIHLAPPLVTNKEKCLIEEKIENIIQQHHVKKEGCLEYEFSLTYYLLLSYKHQSLNYNFTFDIFQIKQSVTELK